MLKFLVKPHRCQMLLSSQVRYFAPKKRAVKKAKTDEKLDQLPIVEAHSVTNTEEIEYLKLLESDPEKARSFKSQNEQKMKSSKQADLFNKFSNMSSLQKAAVEGYNPVFAPNMNTLQDKSAERKVLAGSKLTLHDNIKII